LCLLAALRGTQTGHSGPVVIKYPFTAHSQPNAARMMGDSKG